MRELLAHFLLLGSARCVRAHDKDVLWSSLDRDVLTITRQCGTEIKLIGSELDCS